MNDFIIMTDSCCDLPAQLADKLELTVLPLSFTINGKEHYNYLDGRDISSSHFYRLLREGTQCTTSAANTNAFLSAMEPVLKKGKDILCICFLLLSVPPVLLHKWPQKNWFSNIPITKFIL